jgi:uncharacterized protein YutE (UPF0331/DUF86 family)
MIELTKQNRRYFNTAITPSEADVLRQLANSRNRLVHGALDQPVTSADVQNLIAILKTLRKLANEDRG